MISKENMKIIHYIPSIDRNAGGTSTYMQLLAKELGKIAELHVITHRSDNPLNLENCIVYYLTKYRPLSAHWKQQAKKIINDVMPDIIHVNCCWMPGCAAIQRMAQKRGIKIVLTPHGMLEPWIVKRHYITRKLPALMLYQKAAIRKADCIHSTAESEMKNLYDLGYNSNIRLVKLGIDADGIRIKDTWKKQKQILFLSRVHVKKGINYLIEAASELRKELDGWKIIIAGEGDDEYIEMLNRNITEQGLDNIISLIGGVYGERKWELFRTSDFFVLPTHSENFGLAIAEALASGTPVITTTGTPWQDLNANKCGAWIEIGTKPLVNAMTRFISMTEEELETAGQNGRRLIENKYSAKNMAEQMMIVYRETID